MGIYHGLGQSSVLNILIIESIWLIALIITNNIDCGSLLNFYQAITNWPYFHIYSQLSACESYISLDSNIYHCQYIFANYFWAYRSRAAIQPTCFSKVSNCLQTKSHAKKIYKIYILPFFLLFYWGSLTTRLNCIFACAAGHYGGL